MVYHGPARAMGRRRAALLLALSRVPLVLLLGIVGCAPKVAPAFAQAMADGRAAARRGDEGAAIAAYERAAQAAPSPHDAALAQREHAQILARRGDVAGARRRLQALASQGAPEQRAAALRDLAAVELAAGEREAGLAALDTLVRRYPDSPPARRALLRSLEERSPENAALYLEGVAPALATTSLGATAYYQRARLAEARGELALARDGYLYVADRWPYPAGTLFEDALTRASVLEERLGRPARAIAHLERLLAVREEASLLGSYERSRYAPARFRTGVLYRDALGDKARAAQCFRLVYTTFPDSTLRDDALWAEALLSFDAGRSRDGCVLAARLLRDHPRSKYAACARWRCAELGPAGDARCPEGAPR